MDNKLIRPIGRDGMISKDSELLVVKFSHKTDKVIKNTEKQIKMEITVNLKEMNSISNQSVVSHLITEEIYTKPSKEELSPMHYQTNAEHLLPKLVCHMLQSTVKEDAKQVIFLQICNQMFANAAIQTLEHAMMHV